MTDSTVGHRPETPVADENHDNANLPNTGPGRKSNGSTTTQGEGGDHAPIAADDPDEVNDGSLDYEKMANEPDAQDQFSMLLTGKSYDDLSPEEQDAIDDLIDDIVNGRIEIEVLSEGENGKGGPVIAMEHDVHGVFIPGEPGEPGKIVLADGLTDEEKEVALREEFGEAVAHRASELGLDLADGDAGYRFVLAIGGADVDFETHKDELYTNLASDTTTIQVDGDDVVVKSRQSTDEGANEYLDLVVFYLDGGEDGVDILDRYRIGSVSVDDAGNVIISGVNPDGVAFEIKISVSVDPTTGETTLTMTGTEGDGELFPPFTLIGYEAVEDFTIDLNEVFDNDSSLFVAADTPKFNVEIDYDTGKFVEVKSGSAGMDYFLDWIEGVGGTGYDDYSMTYGDDGNMLIGAVAPDGSRMVFRVTFTVDAYGEPTMTITGARLRSDGVVLQSFPTTEITGQDEIMQAVGYMNFRFNRMGMTSSPDTEFFAVAPDFELGGFYNTSEQIDLDQVRVNTNEGEIPENAVPGDVVGEVEVFVDGRWVPLSELPPSVADRVNVEITEDNGAYEINEKGQIILVDYSLIESAGPLSILVSVDDEAMTAQAIEYEFEIVDVSTEYVPPRSAEGNFVVGETTVGLPEDVEILDSGEFTAEESQEFGTDSASWYIYEDAEGNFVTVIIDSDPSSENYNMVLTTIVVVPEGEVGAGVKMYDANGELVEEFTEEEILAAGEEEEAESSRRGLGVSEGDEQLANFLDSDLIRNHGVGGSTGRSDTSGSNAVMAYAEYYDPDTGEHMIVYTYKDPDTGEWVRKTALYGSAESNNFMTAFNTYSRAERDLGLLGFQAGVQVTGVAGLTAMWGGAGAATKGGGALTGFGAKLGQLFVSGAIAVYTAETSPFFNRQNDALKSVANFEDTDISSVVDWETTPDIETYVYKVGDPIPTDGTGDTPAVETAKLEIQEAEEANQEAEAAILLADEKERTADRQERLADEADILAENDPTPENIEAARDAREVADAAREEADIAMVEAQQAVDNAFMEADEAYYAAEASGDAELIALATGQAETFVGLVALFDTMGTADAARDQRIELGLAALEDYPDGDFPPEVQTELDDALAIEVEAEQQLDVARLNYTSARSKNADLYADFAQAKADNLAAIAEHDAYEEWEALQAYEAAVAAGGTGDVELAAYNTKKDIAAESAVKADSAAAHAEQAKTDATEADHRETEALYQADAETTNAWAYDPQNGQVGTAPISADAVITSQYLVTGPSVEAEFGTTMVQISAYEDPANPGQTITDYVDVDPNSATYGQVIRSSVEVPGVSITVYDGEGTIIGEGVPEEGVATGSRRLASKTPKVTEKGDKTEFDNALPPGAKNVRHYYHQRMSYQTYTTVDPATGESTNWVRVRYVDENGEVQFRVIDVDANPGALAGIQAYFEYINTPGYEKYLSGTAQFAFTAASLSGAVYTYTQEEPPADTENPHHGFNTFAGVVGMAMGVMMIFHRVSAYLKTAKSAKYEIKSVIADAGPAPAVIVGGLGGDGVVHPAGIDVDGDGLADQPLDLENLEFRGGRWVIVYAGEVIDAPTFAGTPSAGGGAVAPQIIQGPDGQMGIDFAVGNATDPNAGDGVPDILIKPGQALVVNGGKLGFYVRQVTSTGAAHNLFVPLSEDMLASGSFGYNNAIPPEAGIYFGDQFVALPPGAPAPTEIEVDADGLFVLIDGIRVPVNVTAAQIRYVNYRGENRFVAVINGQQVPLPANFQATVNDDGVFGFAFTQVVGGAATVGFVPYPDGIADYELEFLDSKAGILVNGDFVAFQNFALVQIEGADGTVEFGIDLNNDGVADFPYNFTDHPHLAIHVNGQPGIDVNGDGAIEAALDPANVNVVIDADANVGLVVPGGEAGVVNVPLVGNNPGSNDYQIGDNGQLQVQEGNGQWIDVGFGESGATVSIVNGAVVLNIPGFGVINLGPPPAGTVVNPNNHNEMLLGGVGGMAVPVPDTAFVDPANPNQLLIGNGQAIELDLADARVIINGAEMWIDLNGNGLPDFLIPAAAGAVHVDVGPADAAGNLPLVLVFPDGTEIPTDMNAQNNLIPVYGDETGTLFTLVPGGPVVTLNGNPTDWGWVWFAGDGTNPPGWATTAANAAAGVVAIVFAVGVALVRATIDGAIQFTVSYEDATPPSGGST